MRGAQIASSVIFLIAGFVVIVGSAPQANGLHYLFFAVGAVQLWRASAEGIEAAAVRRAARAEREREYQEILAELEARDAARSER